MAFVASSVRQEMIARRKSSENPAFADAHLSVCELILLDDEFADLREDVGAANIFWSHEQ